MKNRISSIKKWINRNKVDLLVATSFLILVITTLVINIYLGLYLLAAILMIIAFFIARFSKGGD